VRRLLLSSAAGLVAALGLLGAPAAANPPAPAPTCGDYGTAVQFVKTPSLAAKQALKEEKLVLVLHVSGLFEDPNLT
jgi:hypothetical protein